MKKKQAKPWFRDAINEMDGYTPGYQPTDPTAIKLNTNENPYPPSPKVFEALAELNDTRLRRYPPIYSQEFCRAAAEIHGVHPLMVMAGNGGDELLSILVRCCCGPGRPLAYAIPTYSLYPVLAKIQDAPAIEVPYDDTYAIPEQLKHTGAPLTFLCNPNAPSCTLVPVDAVAELADAVSGILLVDEAYVDFAPETCRPLLKNHPNVLLLRSMSKGYSLAGMRFGYVLGSRGIIEGMLKVKDSYNVNIAAQVAATAALRDQDYFMNNVAKIITERKRLIAELPKLGVKVGPSHTNFLLAQIDRPSAKDIYDQLCQRKIYIRYFEHPGLTDKLRISIGTPLENNALLHALKEIIR